MVRKSESSKARILVAGPLPDSPVIKAGTFSSPRVAALQGLNLFADQRLLPRRPNDNQSATFSRPSLVNGLCQPFPVRRSRQSAARMCSVDRSSVPLINRRAGEILFKPQDVRLGARASHRIDWSSRPPQTDILVRRREADRTQY